MSRLLLLVCVFCLQGAQAADAAARPSERLALIKQRGALVVGVKTDYAPFGMLNAAGMPEGFEHDLAADIAKRLGVTLTKVSVTGANRLQRLEEGLVDVVIATTGDTVERRKIAAMVEPNYYASGVTLFMRPDQSIADWAATRGHKICATQGSYFNRAMAERFLLDLQMFNNARDAKLAVKDRRCVGYLFDNTAIQGDLLLPEWAGYKAPLPPQLVTPWAVAIASRERGTEWEQLLEDTLADWHRSGFLVERERAWRLPPSQFLADMRTLWTSVDADGKPVCARDADNRWPAACRNRVFLNSTDASGLRRMGLWWKEHSGMDLSFVYDGYDRSRFLLGLATTVLLMVLCVLGSILVGVLGAVVIEARVVGVSRVARWFCNIGRMTPPLLVIYVFVFGLGSALVHAVGFAVDPTVVVVLCLSVYAGSSVMVAFLEATKVVRASAPGYRLQLRNFKHVLPLASPSATAALINVSKATMMASAVAVPELLSAVTSIMAENGNVAVMMNTLLLTFFVLIFCATRLLDWVDRKLRGGSP
ncbi:MAG: transporter substrate-binding domain-containing protein [Pseudomonadota bacterium]